MRRLGKQQLSKGWQTWLDGWLEQQRHKRMLAASAGRMQRPMLAAALAHWRTDWQEELRAALEEGQQLLARDKASGLTLAPTLASALTPPLPPTKASGLYQLEKEIERLKEEHALELEALGQKLNGEVLTTAQVCLLCLYLLWLHLLWLHVLWLH